ncbi:dihydroorotate dehydrogenase [Desulfurivibrio alkaliphilus]|uniref:Dihydroorotate dehydrogenase n=1 Tax=Desulfurivibrio alkaliphilus (strain DSM 19089 / UNIQEM U267 / AHT2) TaxID=589865 RepID=D6Z558_DESAT|nr:dihydroorotate dehydrogenase [Desulfurivibrio alkaliphilus]ADH86683.1 dihydroorotate dehydrogenase family protein [Desulfurivibrio alkaliphilus AHT 2]
MTVETDVDLQVEIAGCTFRNPVMTASGTFGYGREFEDFVNVSRLGAVVVKGVSLLPRAGNPPPRVVETPCGMLNAIGLENVGVEAFLHEKLPWLVELGATVVVNILGNTVDEYAQLARRLDGIEGVTALEVNISCPNVKEGGVAFGTDPLMASAVTAAVRRASKLPLIIKLSPNVTDIQLMARSVAESGADAVSLINTLLGMAIDLAGRRPRLANVVGGLSGPAIKPVALRMVWQAAQAVKIPVIGIGGIMTAEDALEFIVAGAHAVQVGTANFVNPGATEEIVEGIAAYLAKQGLKSINQLRNTLIT